MKKIGQAMATVAAATLVLSGCSDPGAGTDSKPTTVSWPSATARLDGVELTLWAAQSSASIPTSVAKSFEEKTGAKVKIVTIPDPYEQGVQTKVATGDVPDLAMWQPTTSMLLSLGAKTRLQSLEGAPWQGRTDPVVQRSGGTLDGVRYSAFVSAPSAMGVWYNKEVFAKHGVATPKNFSDLLDTARQLKSKGQTPFNEMGGEWWASQWAVQVQLAEAAKGGLWDKVNTNKEKFTGPEIQGAIDTYQSMIAEGLFNSDIKTSTFNEQAKSLLAGDTAMAFQVGSLVNNMSKQSDSASIDQRIGFFPISKSGTLATSIPDQTNALVAFKTNDSRREAAARQLLTYWLTEAYPAFVAEQKTVSIMTDVATPAGVPAAIKEANSALSDSVGSMQSSAVANPDLAKNLGDMIAGTKTARQVGEETQSQFAQLARAMGASGF